MGREEGSEEVGEGAGREIAIETHLNLTDRNESFGSTEGDHGRVGRDGEGSFEEFESFILLASTFEDLQMNQRYEKNELESEHETRCQREGEKA